MTETTTGASFTEDGIADEAETLPRAQRRMAPIVPAQNVAGRALVSVIAIMTFLSCLTLGAVTLVRDTASAWENQISREATIQIKPAEGLDMEAALETAANIARGFSGVRDARIVDREATARLLEPWLGSGLNIDDLPVPRLIIVTIDEANPPDFAAMRAMIAPAVVFMESRPRTDHVTQVRPEVRAQPDAKLGERRPCGGRNSVGGAGRSGVTTAIASSISRFTCEAELK